VFVSPNNRVSERLRGVRERIRQAAARADRDPAEVTLVAVSKTFPPEAILPLAEAGQRVFGESRVQEAQAKVPRVASVWSGDPLTWRLVGHLQRNKVRPALAVFDTVDSVDSTRLLVELERSAARVGRRLPVLLQFNCAGEASKSGFDPDALDPVLGALRSLDAVAPGGLMTIGPRQGGLPAAREAFRRLRQVRDALEQGLGKALPDLSMGMSGDFEVGIEEGATLVRVGTALFGERGSPEKEQYRG
jgi:pyridoxal phosphate enzyme (YggS family)